MALYLEPGRCLFQAQHILPQQLIPPAHSLQFVDFRLVESRSTALAFNPLPIRAILSEFKDDLFPQHSRISVGHSTPLPAKMHEENVRTFTLTTHVIWQNSAYAVADDSLLFGESHDR